ncbi:43405_t:CDS:1, partial [Gigaspora margarita]
ILLPAGWALKETQKFGIKGKGKQISKNVVPLLEAFFLARDANKSNRYTAEDMLNKLHSMAHEGLLEDDKIPKLINIANWILEYAKKHCQGLAKQSIEASEIY